MKYYRAKSAREKRRRQLIGLAVGLVLIAMGTLAYLALGLFMDPVPEWLIAPVAIIASAVVIGAELSVGRHPDVGE